MTRASASPRSNGFLQDHPEDLWAALVRDPFDRRLRGALADWHASRGDDDMGDWAGVCRWAADQADRVHDSKAIGGWDGPGEGELNEKLAIASAILRDRLGGWLGRRNSTPPQHWTVIFDGDCCGLKVLIWGRPTTGSDEYGEYEDGNSVVASLCCPDGFFDSGNCGGGWLTRCGPSLAAVQPMTRVVLQGVEPMPVDSPLGGPLWGWRIGPSVGTPVWGGQGDQLYRKLYYALPDGPPGATRRGRYASRADAHAALSWALLKRMRPAEHGEIQWWEYRNWFSEKVRRWQQGRD